MGVNKMVNLKAVLFIIFLSFMSTPSHAFWWMGYHKPAFQGKVIDAETKKPIEGAVVVVTYTKSTIGVPHGYTSIIEVRETLTDKSGEFYVPSYTTIIQPLSSEEWARFIIFKPGYGSFPDYHVSPPKLGVNPEVFFSTRKIGEEGEIEWMWQKIKVTFGIVELPPLKTREERLDASRVGVSGYRAKDLPLLYKALQDEARYLGIPERE